MTVPDLGRGIGFLGGGHMGRALIAALMRRGFAPSRLIVAESNPDTARALTADFGIVIVDRADELPRRVDSIVLAVKPQDLASALQPLQSGLAEHRPLLISVAAGITLQQLRQWSGDEALPIVRAMPNRPAMTGFGATGLHAPPNLEPQLGQRAVAILETAGIVVPVDQEALLDVVTAVSGSGPAYFFRLAEALAAAGIAQGLPADAALRLARATLQGAGSMATPEADLAALRESVTSKGGTTAAALEAFSAMGFEQMIERAVEAAVQRGRDLADQANRGS